MSAAGRLRRGGVDGALLVLGIAVRAALMPLASGQDFRVWDLASSATLRGIDIYAHHPHYPGGPYAYLPLFLWIELPFQWLAGHTAVPFRIFGKVPIVGADIALALLVRRALQRRGCPPGRTTAGFVLVLFNPLILYNGAFYGRFDSLAVALLLGAVLAAGAAPRTSWQAAIWFALAVAAKTFPIVAVLGFLRRGRVAWVRIPVALIVTFVVLLVPYRHSLHPAFHDIVLYDAHKQPQALSWQLLFLDRSHAVESRPVSTAILLAAAVAVVAALWLPAGRDLARYTLLTILVFVLANKVVLEQYLTWPLPFVVLLGLTARRRMRAASWSAYGVLTVVGMVVNPYVHPFGPAPRWLAVLLALVIAGYLVLLAGDRPGVARPVVDIPLPQAE